MPEITDINALSQATGISVRTIRYYLAENLLPPPAGRGPAAIYGPGHRDRLRLIRRLQDDAHLPLAEIRKQLQALDDAGVAQALAAPATAAPPAASAFDYVRQVLAKAQSPQEVREPPPPAHGAAAAVNRERALDQDAAVSRSSAPHPAPGPRKPQRSHWERITLHPDIELHVRRPLARSDQRRLDELLDLAQRLFGDASGAAP